MFFFKNLKKDPVIDNFENDNEKKLFKHFGILVSITLIHVLFGSNEILFDKENKFISPQKFFDKQKKLVKIVSISFLKINGEKNKNIEFLNFFHYKN